MSDAAQMEQLRAQLQDAHLVIGELTVALRRYELVIQQLRGQVEAVELNEAAQEKRPE